MGMSTQQAAEEMKGAKELYLAFCRFTNLPYVTEGEESANDQAWVFTSESQIKEFGKKKLEEKIVLLGMKYEKKNYIYKKFLNMKKLQKILIYMLYIAF